jgi:hypothetical protein
VAISLFPDRQPERRRAEADSIFNKILVSDGRRKSNHVLISSWAHRDRVRELMLPSAQMTESEIPLQLKMTILAMIGANGGQNSVHISASGNGAAAAEFGNKHKDQNKSKSI